MTEKSTDIEYFQFEEDFMADNLRCIPMIVRLKLDTVGIKLSLKAWSRFSENERTRLAVSPCSTPPEMELYKISLLQISNNYLHEPLKYLPIEDKAGWENLEIVPESLKDKCSQFHFQLSIKQWRALSRLQRFALIKLSRPSHESRNFEKAIIEFGLLKKGS